MCIIEHLKLGSTNVKNCIVMNCSKVDAGHASQLSGQDKVKNAKCRYGLVACVVHAIMFRIAAEVATY